MGKQVPVCRHRVSVERGRQRPGPHTALGTSSVLSKQFVSSEWAPTEGGWRLAGRAGYSKQHRSAQTGDGQNPIAYLINGHNGLVNGRRRRQAVEFRAGGHKAVCTLVGVVVILGWRCC